MGTRCADHATPLYPQKLALTSPTDGGRSVGIVCSRTEATEFYIKSNQMKCLVSFYMCKCILRLEGKEFDFACWSWQCQGKWWKTDRVENMVTECMYQQSMDNAWSYTTFEKSSLSLSLSLTHTHTHTHTHNSIISRFALSSGKETRFAFLQLPTKNTHQKENSSSCLLQTL